MDRVKSAEVQVKNSHKVLAESLEKMHGYHFQRGFLSTVSDGYQLLMDYNKAVDNYADSLKELAQRLAKVNKGVPRNIHVLTSYYSEVYDGIESHGKTYKGIYKNIVPCLNDYVGLNAQGKTAIDYQKEKIELKPLEVKMSDKYLNKIENATFSEEILSITAKEKKRLNKYFVIEHKNCLKIKVKLKNLKNKLLEYSNQNMDSFSTSEKQTCVKDVMAYNDLARDYNRGLLELARLEEKIISVREKRFDPKGKEEKLERQLNKYSDLTCKEAKFIRRKLAPFKKRKEAYKKNSRTFAEFRYKVGLARERVDQIADNYYPAYLEKIFDKATLWLPETLPSMESRKEQLEKKVAEILNVGKEPVLADQSAISSTSKKPLKILVGSAVTQNSNGLNSKSQPDVDLSSTELDKPSKVSKLLNRAKRALRINQKAYKVPKRHNRKEDVLSH